MRVAHKPEGKAKVAMETPGNTSGKATKWTPEFKREYMRNSYLANRDVLLARNKANNKKNRARRTAKEKGWPEENPEARRAARSRRRGRKRQAAGRHTAEELREKFEQQDGRCANAACGVELQKTGRDKYHWDHIVPLVRGGSNWISNMQALCAACNTSKSARDPAQWAIETGTPLELKEEDSTVYAGERPRIYTESMTVKLTPEVAEFCRTEAEGAGMKPSEWARMVLEREAKLQPSIRDVLAEVLALRKVLLSFHLKTNRELMAAGKFDDDMLMELVEGADKEKWNQADRKILEARQG